MLKERLTATREVRATFLAAEQAQEYAAIEATRCVLTALEQRRAANLPLNTGLDTIQRLSRAAQLSVEARNELIRAHAELVRLPEQIGLTPRMVGDVGECPPLPEGNGDASHLRVVA
jgi:hypothetical protein